MVHCEPLPEMFTLMPGVALTPDEKCWQPDASGTSPAAGRHETPSGRGWQNSLPRRGGKKWVCIRLLAAGELCTDVNIRSCHTGDFARALSK